jgi:hypothetical protein
MRTDLKGSTGSGTIDADVVSENRRRRTARSDRAQHASASGAPERLPTDIVERMDMDRLGAGVRGSASRLRDFRRGARCCGVKRVAIQRDLQENCWHYLT